MHFLTVNNFKNVYECFNTKYNNNQSFEGKYFDSNEKRKIENGEENVTKYNNTLQNKLIGYIKKVKNWKKKQNWI